MPCPLPLGLLPQFVDKDCAVDAVDCLLLFVVAIHLKTTFLHPPPILEHMFELNNGFKASFRMFSNTHTTTLDGSFPECFHIPRESVVIRHVSYTLRRLSPQEFAIALPHLVDIYIAAMDYNPSVREGSISRWRADLIRPGFSCVVATDEYGIAGFAYGFLGTPDTWWDKQLRRALAACGGPTPEQEEILHNYFELAEIHVLPAKQGHGLGRALLEALAWNLPAHYILLSTPEVPHEANSAFGLYRKMGFGDFLRDLHYPADSRPFAILQSTVPLAPTDTT